MLVAQVKKYNTVFLQKQDSQAYREWAMDQLLHARQLPTKTYRPDNVEILSLPFMTTANSVIEKELLRSDLSQAQGEEGPSSLNTLSIVNHASGQPME